MSNVFEMLKERFAWQRKPIVRAEGVRLKGTRTRNGVGITRVKDCPVCGKAFRLHPGSGRMVKHGERHGWPANQCGAHAEMKKQPKEKKKRRKKK